VSLQAIFFPDEANKIPSYFGRRTVYVVGMAAMAIELCIIGILNPWTKRTSVGWTQAVLTLVWTFTFQLSAGQLGWALPAEIGSTRLRQKTVCLARNVSNIAGVIGGTLENYMVRSISRRQTSIIANRW
jgi:MFS transporter, SP family, general alpha glucoside:H+ symporter